MALIESCAGSEIQQAFRLEYCLVREFFWDHIVFFGGIYVRYDGVTLPEGG